MNIRKVLAGSMAAMAAGATIAFGAFAQSSSLGDYVDNSGSTPVPPWIIIGPGNGNAEYAKDVLGAADIGAGVAGYATSDRAIGGTTEVSVSGGVTLSTANTQILSGDYISVAKDTLTSEDLPTILASGTFEDDDGNTYDYDQYIVIGNRQVLLSDSGSDLDDPAILINIGTTATDPLYTLRIVFNDDLNFSNSDVDGNEIELFGTPYTISADSDTDTLVLFGGSNKQTLAEGETSTVEVGGVSYAIELLGVSDENTAVVKVDDQSRSIDEGESRRVAGLDVYLDEVYFLSKESQSSSAKLSFGSSKLTMDDDDEVSVGDTDPEDIDNTKVTFTQGTDGTSVLEIKVAAQDDDEDHIIVDEPYTDPVFGTFKVAFGGASPGLADMALFEFDTSGDETATVKFTDAKGVEKTIEYAKDNAATDNGVIDFLDDDDNAYVVVEGQNATEDDYIVINQDDFSHLLQVNEIDLDPANDVGTLALKDVFSGTTYEVNLDEFATNYFDGDKVIDGKTYHFWAEEAGAVDVCAVVWGTGSNAAVATPVTGLGVAGGALSVFPTILAEQDAEVALFDTMNIGLNVNGSGNDVEIFGILIENFPNGTSIITGTNIDIEYTSTTGILIVEEVIQPSVAILEEEGEDASGNDKQNIVIVDTEDNADGITIEQPIFSDDLVGSYLGTSDSDIDVNGDRYGAFVSYNSDDQGSAEVYYPDNQVIMAVGIGANPVFSISGESGTVQEAYQITTPIAKLSNEITSPSSLSRDVIIFGGPCANPLVATLMDVSGDWPECFADFEDLNQGMIQEYTDAFGSGQKALVIAGKTGADTRALAARVLSGTMDYSA